MEEVSLAADDRDDVSRDVYVDPFTRYVFYVEAQPVATSRHGAISNMLFFTSDMSG